LATKFGVLADGCKHSACRSYRSIIAREIFFCTAKRTSYRSAVHHTKLLSGHGCRGYFHNKCSHLHSTYTLFM